MKIYVCVPDYGYEGYGEPEKAFSTVEAAEAWVREYPNDRALFEMELDKPSTALKIELSHDATGNKLEGNVLKQSPEPFTCSYCGELIPKGYNHVCGIGTYQANSTAEPYTCQSCGEQITKGHTHACGNTVYYTSLGVYVGDAK